MNEHVLMMVAVTVNSLSDEEFQSILLAANTPDAFGPDCVGYEKIRALFRYGVHREQKEAINYLAERR
jgi:hypothetical protein